jgi:hypothetical protein
LSNSQTNPTPNRLLGAKVTASQPIALHMDGDLSGQGYLVIKVVVVLLLVLCVGIGILNCDQSSSEEDPQIALSKQDLLDTSQCKGSWAQYYLIADETSKQGIELLFSFYLFLYPFSSYSSSSSYLFLL